VTRVEHRREAERLIEHVKATEGWAGWGPQAVTNCLLLINAHATLSLDSEAAGTTQRRTA